MEQGGTGIFFFREKKLLFFLRQLKNPDFMAYYPLY